MFTPIVIELGKPKRVVLPPNARGIILEKAVNGAEDIPFFNIKCTGNNVVAYSRGNYPNKSLFFSDGVSKKSESFNYPPNSVIELEIQPIGALPEVVENHKKAKTTISVMAAIIDTHGNTIFHQFPN